MSSTSDKTRGAPPVIDNIEQLRARVAQWRQSKESIVLVPTMGNLHAGHLELVKAANAWGQRTVVSIFVNPTQFGENEDFDEYPRTLDADIEKLSAYNVDMVFAPVVGEMYSNIDKTTYVEVPSLADMLEGEVRPGFFRGVATVVNKLFNIVQPDVAVFGEKDYQQLLVIRQMVRQLNMPIEIHSVATVRESDGLALSSRNAYLDSDQRQLATQLYVALQSVVDSVQQGGDVNYAVGEASRALDAADFVVDYVVVRRQSDLHVPQIDESELCDKSLIILGAACLGHTRLIDNIRFNLNS